MSFKVLVKICLHLVAWIVICVASLFHSTGVYLANQAIGQIKVLSGRQSFEDYISEVKPDKKEIEKLKFIQSIKQYSEDSLGFKPTKNFSKIYNHNNVPLLWVVSASEKYAIQPFYWSFPIVGDVSYKGFFTKEKAIAEKNRLIGLGYDVDVRPVSAWSTLGWFSDPVLSGMLTRSKGWLCNLIFHELFHATYYAPSSVNYNENLASFVGHKATLQFLVSDTAALNAYQKSYADNKVIDDYTGEVISQLNHLYDSIASFSENTKLILKQQRIHRLLNGYNTLRISGKDKVNRLVEQIKSSGNAWFVDFEQYNALQDSLERDFNKIYKSNLREMVQSLK